MNTTRRRSNRRAQRAVVLSPYTTLSTSPVSSMRKSGSGVVVAATPLIVQWGALPGTAGADGTSRISSLEFDVTASSTVAGVLKVTMYDAAGVEQIVSQQFSVGTATERFKLRMPKSANFEFASAASNAVKFEDLSALGSSNITVSYVVNYSVKGLQ